MRVMIEYKVVDGVIVEINGYPVNDYQGGDANEQKNG